MKQQFLIFLSILVVSAQSSLVIELPRDFCELDNPDGCKAGQCMRYDPRKFASSTSLVIYLPSDRRLGNVISAYIISLWIYLEHGYRVFIDKAAYNQLGLYFRNIDKTPVKILEESLCDWDQFGFEGFEGTIAQLGQESWAKGHAIQIVANTNNINWLQFQASGKYFKIHWKETKFALEMHHKFTRHADVALNKIAKKIGKPSSKITFVGIHDRRADFLVFRKKVLLTDDLEPDYFTEAMEYFREEYGDTTEVVFVYVSDDMTWGPQHLGDEKNIFFSGCGKPDTPECIGRDFALLSSCNHTIVTHGSLGLWAALSTGGEFHTEYGAIVPEAYV